MVQGYTYECLCTARLYYIFIFFFLHNMYIMYIPFLVTLSVLGFAGSVFLVPLLLALLGHVHNA